MQYHQLPSAAASQVTVTTTPQTLEQLIDTANGGASNLPKSLNACEFQPEGGNIRYLLDGNAPSTTVGFLLANGNARLVRRDTIAKIQLVATTGTVTCQVQVGTTN